MNVGAAQVYVYYRVKAGDAASAIAAARALQIDLQTRMPGLVCSLSQRAERNDDDLQTLMETYAHAGGISADQQRAIQAAARTLLGAWIVGERHVEIFVPCA